MPPLPPFSFRFEVPRWLRERIQDLTPAPVRGRDAWAMQWAVSLARENIRQGNGGPFGAMVVDGDGRVLSAAVNLVTGRRCSVLHAEIVALCLAQRAIRSASFNRHPVPVTLYTSVEPCDMCLGAIRWSGLHRLVCGATRADAEAIGFDEGPRSENWTESLTQRGIRVRVHCLRDAARRVLQDYAAQGGEIYGAQPGTG